MLRKAFPERTAIAPRYELTGAGIMNVTHDSAERLNERESPKHRLDYQDTCRSVTV